MESAPGVAAIRGARTLQRGLAAAYPDARCELDHRDAFELLVATVLSAQTTDQRVNQVTPQLFSRWPTPDALAGADIAAVREIIAPLGMAANKSRFLVELSARLVSEHQGQVPGTLAALEKLPGVGRKTAHVVLGECFGIPSLTIDTHFARLAHRFGWSQRETPREIEDDVAALFAKQDLTLLSHQVIIHGRRCCTARKPACTRCPVAKLCPAAGTA
ncbi:endonuclease III [Micrococcales bacterium 31B]|nr:endonuclease III [Micrococcales bacterium 31B]